MPPKIDHFPARSSWISNSSGSILLNAVILSAKSGPMVPEIVAIFELNELDLSRQRRELYKSPPKAGLSGSRARNDT